MVAKKDGETQNKGPKVKVGKLGVKKETVKNLSGDEAKDVRGGGGTHSEARSACCPKSYNLAC